MTATPRHLGRISPQSRRDADTRRRHRRRSECFPPLCVQPKHNDDVFPARRRLETSFSLKTTSASRTPKVPGLDITPDLYLILFHVIIIKPDRISKFKKI